MYKYLILFLFFVSCSSEPATTNNSLTIESLQKAAMKQYMESPVLALPMMEKLADKYAENKTHKEASETYFNIASIYDKTVNNKEKAIGNLQKSLDQARLSKDQEQQANLLQYMGYLKALAGKTKEGKKDIADAIMIHKTTGNHLGAAGAEFNLSRIFFIEGALDDSAHFLTKSTSHFKKINDFDNVFTNNLFAISLFTKMHQLEMVQKAIDENRSLIPSVKYEGYLKQEFERLTQ